MSGRPLVAALAVVLLGSAGRAADAGRREAARAAVDELRTFDGTTAGPEVAARLERLAELGADAATEAEALVRLLEDRSPLFRGRDAHEVVRLRALALRALARIGPPPGSAPLIAEQLAESVDPRAIAAAARAFARLPGERRWGLRPLIRAFRSEMADETLNLDRYDPRAAPGGSRTTMRLEVLGALRSLGPQASEAVPFLEAARRVAGEPGSLQERLRREAEATLAVIRDASGACPECAADAGPAARFASPWRAPSERAVAAVVPDLSFTDQAGRPWTWRTLTEVPSAVTFFYARCQNPNRCERTMARVAELRGRLEEQGIAGSVRVVGVTMEPAWDTPLVLKAYARDHHLATDAHLMLLRPDPAAPYVLSDVLEAPVNRSGDQVNTHGTALYLLDRRGRVARTYRSLLWDPAEVARDLRRLLDEPRELRRRP